MNIKYLNVYFKLTLLGSIMVILSYLIWPTRPYYEKIDIRIVTPTSVNLDSVKLNIFDDEKNNKIEYHLLHHDYKEEVLNFNARFFCFSKKIPDMKLYVISTPLHIREDLSDTDCPYGATYAPEIKTVFNKNVFISQLSVFILRTFLCFGLVLIFHHYLYRKRKTLKVIFPILLSIQLFVLYLGNPGRFEIDFQNALYVANSHHTWDWLSLIYHIFVKGMIQMIDSHYPIVILQCILFALFMSYTALIYRAATNTYWPIALVVIISILPSILFMNIYISRDWYFMFLFRYAFSFLFPGCLWIVGLNLLWTTSLCV